MKPQLPAHKTRTLLCLLLVLFNLTLVSSQWIYWLDKLLLCFQRQTFPITQVSVSFFYLEICGTFTDVHSSCMIVGLLFFHRKYLYSSSVLWIVFSFKNYVNGTWNVMYWNHRTGRNIMGFPHDWAGNRIQGCGLPVRFLRQWHWAYCSGSSSKGQEGDFHSIFQKH